MKSITEYITERKLGKGWKEYSKDEFKATILSFDEPSEEYGIDGGKISKLEIRKGGKVVCNYDRGWDSNENDTKPNFDKNLESFYNEVLQKYN